MAKVSRFTDWDEGAALLVHGTDPAQILADAAKEIDEGEVITTTLQDVEVRWWRTTPCHPNSCPESGHCRIHYHATRGPSRGGFQAAEILLGFKEGS